MKRKLRREMSKKIASFFERRKAGRMTNERGKRKRRENNCRRRKTKKYEKN